MSDKGSLSGASVGFASLTFFNQIGVLLAAALAISIGIYVAMWAKSPNWVPVYAHLDSAEVSKVVEALQQSGVEYKFNESGSGVLVSSNKVSEVRMKLASLGLPKNSGIGLEIMDKPKGLGTSQFAESIQHIRGLEGEISRTISALESVRSARVHLGLQKTSSFLKKNGVSSASVMIDVHGGYNLSREQVAGIVHLVASSVPGLKKDAISVVDQSGKLLNSGEQNTEEVAANEQFSQNRQIEQMYTKRVKDILTPIVGIGNVQAQVSAEIDFTFSETTQEVFDSEKRALKSEAILDERRIGDKEPLGVPGALSNQPPSTGEAPEVAAADAAPAEEGTAPEGTDVAVVQGNKRQQATRNYEVGKSITHIKNNRSKLLRLSVAVVVNDKITYDAEGNEIRTPLTEEDITKLDTLVKDAVGYNEERGDKVSVISTSFAAVPPVLPAPPLQIYEQEWFVPVVKQALAGLLILIIVFTVIRPMIKNLSKAVPIIAPPPPSSDDDNPDLDQAEREKALAKSLPPKNLLAEERFDMVKQIAADDSAKVAQVVKNWVGKEDD